MKEKTKWKIIEDLLQWMKEDITYGEMKELSKDEKFIILEELCKELNQKMIDIDSLRRVRNNE